MRRALKITAAAVAPAAAVAVYVLFTLPPRAVSLPNALPQTVVYGGYHIHSARSDGSGTVDDIAAAAARAGLGFIILTDHGDATRAPLVPAYRHGVLTLDAAEIGTTGGHLVALNLTAASPYPLAGEPADVLEDVHRMGGWGIVAHPDSPKPELRWRQWNVPYDAVEWLNADSEWRDETTLHLIETTGRYLVRPVESIAALFARPVTTLRRWDAASRLRPIVGMAALDAHARIGWDQAEEPRRRTLVARPTYDEMFRTLAQAVVLEHPLGGDPVSDAAAVTNALIAGHTFSVLRAIATPASLSFRVSDGQQTAGMGDRLDASGGPLTFQAAVPEAAQATLHLMRNGIDVKSARGTLDFSAAFVPGAYRIEVTYPGSTLPWLVSNPVYVGVPPPSMPEPARPTPQTFVALPGEAGWTIEHDSSSTGVVDAADGGWNLTFKLGGGEPAGQYAALVSQTEGAAGFDRVQFTARADRPMRVSVQVRLLGGRDGQRWRRSVFVDTTARTIVVPLQDFEPVGMVTSQRPIVARVKSVLFVVDTLNTPPGTAGKLWVSKPVLGVGDPDRER